MSANQDIKKDVDDELYWDDRVDAAEVKVEVRNGRVTLSGTVPTYLARRAATDDAYVVAGVNEVRNELQVRHPESIYPPSDLEIEAAATDVLNRDPDIDVRSLVVEVQDGRVTLAGTVDAFWKKMHAEELVSRLQGVLSAENLLAVVPTADAHDQRIGEEIMAALERNAVVDARQISVCIDDGNVTLSGTVPHWAAREAASRAAYHTSGVRHVENRIGVARE